MKCFVATDLVYGQLCIWSQPTHGSAVITQNISAVDPTRVQT